MYISYICSYIRMTVVKFNWIKIINSKVFLSSLQRLFCRHIYICFLNGSLLLLTNIKFECVRMVLFDKNPSVIQPVDQWCQPTTVSTLDQNPWRHMISLVHYDAVIVGAMASQITSRTIVYSTVYSDADQRKHQSSASLAFVRGIHRGPVNSPHKWPVNAGNVSIIMMSSCVWCSRSLAHIFGIAGHYFMHNDRATGLQKFYGNKAYFETKSTAHSKLIYDYAIVLLK